MESLSLIEYKWQQGVYTLQQMMRMVENHIITKDQFFELTRFYYDGVKKSKQTNE